MSDAGKSDSFAEIIKDLKGEIIGDLKQTVVDSAGKYGLLITVYHILTEHVPVMVYDPDAKRLLVTFAQGPCGRQLSIDVQQELSDKELEQIGPGVLLSWVMGVLLDETGIRHFGFPALLKNEFIQVMVA